MDEFNEKLWDEKHRQVKTRLDTHEKKLNEHDDEIEELKISDTMHDEQIMMVIRRMDEIISQNRWFIGIVVVQLLGFFFVVIENLAFK